MGTTAILAKLYLPMLLFLLFCLLAIFAEKAAGVPEINISLGPIQLARVPVRTLWILRALLIVLAFACAGAYVIDDYTTLFSKNLTMQVFYDQAGLRRSIASLSPLQIPRLVDLDKCGNCQQEYFAQFDKEVKAAFPNIPPFFTSGQVHSTGKSYTVVQKTLGLQNYRVTQSGGILANELDLPNQSPITFQTKNEKQDTPDDYLNLGNLGALRGVLLFTKYKQFLLPHGVDECGLNYKVALYAATKVSVFPWPDISNTVYLVEGKDGLVPIAYATIQYAGADAGPEHASEGLPNQFSGQAVVARQ